MRMKIAENFCKRMDNEWGNKKPAHKLNSHIVIGRLHEACVFVCEHVVENLIQFGRK